MENRVTVELGDANGFRIHFGSITEEFSDALVVSRKESNRDGFWFKKLMEWEEYACF